MQVMAFSRPVNSSHQVPDLSIFTIQVGQVPDLPSAPHDFPQRPHIPQSNIFASIDVFYFP